MSEPVVDALDHLVRERVAELVRVYVRFAGRVAHEVREEAFDDAVLADDATCALGAFGREDGLLLLAALDEPVRLEPLEHLARRRAETPSISATRDAIAVDPVAGRYSPIGKARK